MRGPITLGNFLKITPGTIYFVRETDRETGKLSDLVKIGLVNGNKSPWERLKAHQTGNPRKLVFEAGQFVETSAVGYVEWLLHKTFAAERVGGEWFLLPEKSDVDRVVAKAMEIASEVSNRIPLIEEADRLSALTSSSPAIDPTEEIKSKSWEFALLQKQSTMTETLKKATSSCFGKVVEEFGEEVLADHVEFTDVTPKSKFSPELLMKKYPELYKKFVRTNQVLVGQKLVLEKTAKESDLPDEFGNLKSKIKERNELALSSGDYYLLNENLTLLDEFKSSIDWQLKVADAQLKVFCGSAEGVIGLYSWHRRYEAGKPYFLELDLIRDHNVEYLDCFDTKSPSVRKKAISQV